MKIIVITGQTATGKTNLALELARQNNGEIVNFDSRQLYRYLNIITGKYETPKRMFKKPNNIPLWLFDIVKPNEYFSSFDYKEKVIPVIFDILKRKKTPVLVGGSYFYLKHLLYDIETEQIPANLELRKKLNNWTVDKLQQKLLENNAILFNSLNNSDRNNPQRLIRKIEISTNQPRGLDIHSSSTITLAKKLGMKNLVITILGYKFATRDKLLASIIKRVNERLKMGAVNEVKNILKKYSAGDPGLKTIGYQQIIGYINKNIALDKAVNQWIFKEIQYAKRQLTFMKKDSNIKWTTI